MRRLSLFAAIVLSSPVLAGPPKKGGAAAARPGVVFKPFGVFQSADFCYPTFPLGYSVVRKIDETHYEAVRAENGAGCNLAHCRAFIELQHFDPGLVGPLNTMVQYLGSKDVELANGFTATFDALRECGKVRPCGDHGMNRCPE